VPPLSVKRDSNEYAPPSAPDALLKLPVPVRRSPFHSAFAFLIAIPAPSSWFQEGRMVPRAPR
jgi:hypothetical protein